MLANSSKMSGVGECNQHPSTPNHIPEIGVSRHMAKSHSIFPAHKCHSIFPAHKCLSPEQVARFWATVLKLPSGCWEWQRIATNDGYGIFCANHNRGLAHRVAWELANQRATPVGFQYDHLCRNRICVNPAHLDIVTVRINVLRGEGPAARHARKTHCVHGHPLSGDNLRIDTRGYRQCRTCYSAWREQGDSRRRRSRLDAGVCVDCLMPSSGRYRCDECRKKNNARSVEWRRKRR